MPARSTSNPQKIITSAHRLAIEAAKSVIGYANLILIIGTLAGLLLIVVGILSATSNDSPVYAILGLVGGLLIILISLLQGALYRMISNYVIAKLD